MLTYYWHFAGLSGLYLIFTVAKWATVGNGEYTICLQRKQF